MPVSAGVAIDAQFWLTRVTQCNACTDVNSPTIRREFESINVSMRADVNYKHSVPYWSIDGKGRILRPSVQKRGFKTVFEVIVYSQPVLALSDSIYRNRYSRS